MSKADTCYKRDQHSSNEKTADVTLEKGQFDGKTTWDKQLSALDS
jgi:hypothetical protein